MTSKVLVNTPFLTPLEYRTRLNVLLPYGSRAPLFNAVIKDLFNHIDNDSNADRDRLVGAILNKTLKIKFEY